MKYLTEKEERQLIRTVSQVKGKKAERDRMILLLGFGGGLRLGEIAGLNVGDVRSKERLFVRPETSKRTVLGPSKTRKAKGRTVPLSVNLQKAIHKFIRHKLTWHEGIHDNNPLFVSKKGGRLSKRMIEVLFSEWCKKTNLCTSGKADYSAHSMRHSFAMRLIERGVRITTVQKLLGHASLASTGVYTEASIEEMEEAVNAR